MVKIIIAKEEKGRMMKDYQKSAIDVEFDVPEGTHTPNVQREYIPKHEGEILDAVLRGHDIECELLDAIRVLYEVNIVYFNRRWRAMDVREEAYGTAIRNPKTGDGSFPHLTSLLRWCQENRYAIKTG